MEASGSERADATESLRTSYAYSPLNETEGEIRLLLLRSNRGRHDSNDDEICCSLFHVSIDDVPPFEALSYVWGEVASPSAIILDGHPFQTTQNLYNALVCLRKDDEDRCLWVDALCINQADTHGRSSQVAEMRLIYQRASSVVVFLGEQEEGCHAVLDLFEKGAQDPTLHWDPTLHPHIESHGMDAGSRILQGYIINYFSVSWWFRLWTVQEYCLAQQVVFQMGIRAISEDLIRDCIYHQWRHQSTCCRGSIDFLIPETGAPVGFSVVSAMAHLKTLGSYRYAQSPHYLTAISDFRTRQCLDPRDKIYGILGLLNPQLRSRIRPDYTRSPAEIFTEVALESVTITESLDMLSLVYGKRTKELNIPSFVPDWTAYVDIWCHRSVGRKENWLRLHNASDGSSINLQRAIPGEVTTSGVCVDKLASFAKHTGTMWKAMLNACRKMAGVDTDTKTPYASKTTAFWHTLCGGSIWSAEDQYRSVEESDYPQYKRWEELIDNDLPRFPVSEEMLGVTVAIDMMTLLRIFTVTEKGHYGWVSEDTEEGDIVVLLSGGKVPYVLRPVNEQTRSAESVGDTAPGGNDHSESRSYTFVGDAYIHGMMQGECYDRDRIETFRLV